MEDHVITKELPQRIRSIAPSFVIITTTDGGRKGMIMRKKRINRERS